MDILTVVVVLGVMGFPLHSVNAGSTLAPTTAASNVYDYICYPNNTITVSGLPTSYTINYFAIQSDGTNCSVTGNQAAGTAEITECDKDVAIYFTFGTYADMLTNQIQGGQEVEIVNITCNEISQAGVLQSINNSYGANIAFKEQADMNVTYGVSSALNRTAANVGDPIEWTITFPQNYTLQITSCTAYEGTDNTGANSILLITNWCSNVTELVSSFTTNSEDTVASAVIQAFKFYGNANVFLQCQLLVCPPSSPGGTCISSCGGKRKRRSSRDIGDSYKATVGKVLHITDPNSSASTQCTGLFLSFLLMTLVSLL